MSKTREAQFSNRSQQDDKHDVSSWTEFFFLDFVSFVVKTLLPFPTASLRPCAFALIRLVIIRPPGELLAIAGGVQIGVPRVAEGNFPCVPKMSQVARRHLQNLARLITPQPPTFAGIVFGNLRIIHDALCTDLLTTATNIFAEMKTFAHKNLIAIV